jgi:hypothetical protein
MVTASDMIADPLGVVYPPRSAQPLPDFDARTHALRRLREFISVLDLRRTGMKGQTKQYRIPIRDIHYEQPDSVKDLAFPGVGMLPGRGRSTPYGLGAPRIDEGSIDVYGVGTALVCLSEYVEQFTIELWASQRAERRSLVAGITTALRSSETSYSIRLTLPNYFNRVATFALDDQQYVDDPDVVRGRRRAHLIVTLSVPEVVLVNVSRLRPYFTVECSTDDLPTPVATVEAWDD